MTTETAIEAVGVQRVYGSTPALTDANLTVGPGEIHALLGENGAGKSTLVRLLAGLEQPDGGEIRLFGRPAGTLSKAARAELGIAFIHQDLGLVESLSALDNVTLGQPYPTRFGLIRTAALRSRARALFESLGATIDLDRPVGELPPAEQAIIAIARAIGVGARIIVLDEPTARLHAGEVRGLFALLSRLRDSGVACLLITHRLDDVLAVCDRVTVLRDGRTAGMRGRAELDKAELVSLIVGRAPAAPASAPPRTTAAPPVLDVHGLQGVGYGPLDLRVGEGEIVGLTGLADAGHDQVALALVGAAPAAGGRIEIDGTPRTLASPAAALRAGIGYVPADRRADGLAMTLTAGENIFLAGRGPDGSGRRLRRGAERAAATDVLDRFGVRPAEPGRTVDTFSGGNQQKILLARALGSRPRLLVLHEPTAAVDVGARADIYALLRARCVQDGCGALVVTSDLEEAANLCDRVVVLQRGQLVADLAGPQADIDTITTLAYGGAS